MSNVLRKVCALSVILHKIMQSMIRMYIQSCGTTKTKEKSIRPIKQKSERNMDMYKKLLKEKQGAYDCGLSTAK